MSREFKIDLSEAMVRKAVCAVWIRRAGLKLAVYIIGAAGLVLFEFFSGKVDAVAPIFLCVIIALVFYAKKQYKKHLESISNSSKAESS